MGLIPDEDEEREVLAGALAELDDEARHAVERILANSRVDDRVLLLRWRGCRWDELFTELDRHLRSCAVLALLLTERFDGEPPAELLKVATTALTLARAPVLAARGAAQEEEGE